MARGSDAVQPGTRSKHPQPVLAAGGLLPLTGNDGEANSTSGTVSQPPSRPQSSTHTRNSSYRTSHDNSDSEEDEGLQMPRSNGSRPPPVISRTASDATSKRRQSQSDNAISDSDSLYHVRHGWAEQLSTEEAAAALSKTFFMYFEDKRHETAGNPDPSFDPASIVCDWRMRDRLKTVSAVLTACLNIGVDPPDVIKTNPCARLECWVEPMPPDGNNSSSTNNSNAAIGKNLQTQYESLALRTRYKVVLDPTMEELKRYTVSQRKNAHHERTLLHYNGHGVPKPTASGEVWCFNRSYTQYIPLPVGDLLEWVGAPGLWVWDCSAASGIIKSALAAVELKKGAQASESGRTHTATSWDDSIHLAACRENEVLPTNPDLPADIFTSCLTTPIAMAVRYFLLQNPLKPTWNITLDQARKIPGKVSERRTPLGELNWIFTAITDTIAWNSLDKGLFKKLFRQDLMVAALFRNFLLAQRVMRMYHCHPQSHPKIPDTHDHPLWRSWDLAVEMILNQLPRLFEQQKVIEEAEQNAASNGAPPPGLELDYTHSDFFADQLSAFEVYLQSAPSNARSTGHIQPPEQLPIVLQVLLSQVHRLRALILLSKFLDLGPWAVNLALSIGIFPYVLKLLQSQAIELKPPMIFIWARILAVDQSCQADLVKEGGFQYFTAIINPAATIPIQNVAEHRAMCAFVISMFCKDFKQGQENIMSHTPELVEHCLHHLEDMENPLLRQFSLLCLGNLWKGCPEAKEAALEQRAHKRVHDKSHDPIAEVRTACLVALTSFVSTGPVDATVMEEEESIAWVVITMGLDGNVMVRKELAVFYSAFAKRYEGKFVVAAWEQLLEERDKRPGRQGTNDVSIGAGMSLPNGVHDSNEREHTNGINGSMSSHRREVSFAQSERSTGTRSTLTNASANASRTLSKKTVYRTVWRQIMILSADPHADVAKNASMIVDYVVNALLESPLGPYANEVLDELVTRETKKADSQAPTSYPDGLSRQRSKEASRPKTPPSPAPSTISKAESGYFGLSRTASVAGAMKNLIWGARTPAEIATPPSPSRSHRNSINADRPAYRSRHPLTAADAALLPPDALDNIQGPAHQPKAKVPPPPNFVERKSLAVPELPLKSSYFTWSASYFRDAQMRPAEAEQPGSLDYNERLWRRNRNDKIIASTQPLKEAAGSQRWDTPCGYFGIGAAPAKMVLHQFEDHIVTSDDRDSIAVWDWRDSRQLCRFSNGNPRGTRVTELRFINEDDNAMLMTGSSDGVIRIFKNYDSPKRIELASSFRALNDLIVSQGGNAGLVFDWQQGQGRILVGGDDRVIRVWQAGHEICIQDIAARSSSCITSLTSDQVEGNVFVAGYGNGAMRAFDIRLPALDAMIMDWTDRKTDHRSWIVGAHLQRGGLRELISAESNGGVRLWDIRLRGAVAKLDGPSKSSRASSSSRNFLRSLSVHEHAPVFATGGADHTIRVYNTRLQHLSSSEPYMSYLRTAVKGGQAAPITATAFHPHRMMLACGAVNDGHVNLFRCDAASASTGQGGDGQAVVEAWEGGR